MAEHRFHISKTKRPLEAGLPVLECKYLYIGPPTRFDPDPRRGILHSWTAENVYILWGDDIEPTVHTREELLAWDASIAAYHRPSVLMTHITRFEED